MRQKLLFFGDSITEFAYQPDQFTTGSALNAIYSRKLDIIHRGYAGYNSRWGLKILPKILEQDGEGVVLSTLFFGANDSCIAGPQRVPIDEFKENTLAMLKLFQEKNIKVVVVGPALLDRPRWESNRPEETKMGYLRTEEEFQKYGQVLKACAHLTNSAFVDLNKAFIEKGGDDWRELLTDGLHFSGKGYEIFFDELMQVIKDKFPQYSPENLPSDYPYWKDVKADMSNL
ncbi:isoamyl acetate-hydrolyzing esterase NDAI_0C01520 [Naumovozyma dairenensis CBS 421]|uniref:SGNH hydrolase-type esterase domain-containing protein n=1 Tax=Naumovozyma dairenensis (strain ATCC 10597 / BCRC 20456 / CBS 421 / NBRC 0211 / NRRL Y-12639) TaxID=1071378 RepID=G0W7Q2_NAUDC|nr:hypothetical protein NDAI_0C01520 [Naumovozyma dairenensis CBS 421]CCD23813.1 hypothetical protein NDAI_0C01520 [Naumovozyma dairenensis CBS 421]